MKDPASWEPTMDFDQKRSGNGSLNVRTTVDQTKSKTYLVNVWERNEQRRNGSVTEVF